MSKSFDKLLDGDRAVVYRSSMQVRTRQSRPKNEETLCIRIIPRKGQKQVAGSRSMIVHGVSVAKMDGIVRRAIKRETER